jgi:hypothetical protein
MNLVKRIYKQGVIILLPLAAASAFFEWKKLPISILVGGLLGFANLKGLSWGLEKFFGPYRPSGKLILLSIVRLFILTCILIILAALKLVNLLGILIGFTVIFILIIKEGLLATKEDSTKEENPPSS